MRLVTTVEGPSVQVPLPGEPFTAFQSRVSRAVTGHIIRTVVAPIIGIAIISAAIAFGFVAQAVVL